MVADGNWRGYRHLLPAFWDEARAYGLPLPTEEPISAPSFCEARHKITSDLLKYILHQIATNAFGDGRPLPQRWHGRRVFATDGAKITLQRNDELERAFGIPDGAHCPRYSSASSSMSAPNFRWTSRSPHSPPVSGITSSR